MCLIFHSWCRTFALLIWFLRVKVIRTLIIMEPLIRHISMYILVHVSQYDRTWPGLCCFARESKAFLSFQKSMKLFMVAELAEVRRWVTQLCVLLLQDVWGYIFFFFNVGRRGHTGALWALLTGALWDERIRGDWQLGSFPSFIVSSTYCLLQWGKLIMSSTPCFTPLPFYSDHQHTWKS